ncbi:thioether cross-link-forming SCIFF peptide maturase [Peptoniphilus sp. KCTC 25270]|uniref:thioether cross-link-forming SCIFF peptide maturase n=1 Tax=Peptoniphilus sp. KCTC 25270 TaxID=2897414 RepID=UPI001E4ADD35|nr:thioether cross-link-forming SCIFF peptide maturase [Peptoniphilus sp. KCTC 25270]MCD1147040.1 thioether cross-link-forming SCIFF peptide maturase [Peptoniphilus sp. KCTC 25270]
MKHIHRFHLNNQYIVLDVASGAVHIVDPIIYDIVEDVWEKDYNQIVEKYQSQYSKEDLKEAFEELQYLMEEGLLYTEDSELELSKFNPEFNIKAMCLHVSHDCNLRCKYCFASQGDFKGQRMLMDLETGKKALDFILENSGNRHNLEVDFFGGEPLMNFDLVKDLVVYGREREKDFNKHFRFTMTTNGVLLDDEIIEFLNREMDNVVLSLDGRESVNDEMRPTVNEKGSYELIVPKFKKLVDGRGEKDYFIRGTFTNHNLDFSKDVELYHELGFNKTSMEPVVTDSKEEYAIREEHLEEILKEYEILSEKYLEIRKENPEFNFFHFNIDLSGGPCAYKKAIGCGAGSEYIAVTPEGDVYPCHQFVGEEEYKLGTIYDKQLNRELQEKFQNADVYHKESCNVCWAKYYCSGGCHANAYYNNNDIMKPFELGCEMEKKRLECALSIYANEVE